MILTLLYHRKEITEMFEQMREEIDVALNGNERVNLLKEFKLGRIYVIAHFSQQGIIELLYIIVPVFLFKMERFLVPVGVPGKWRHCARQMVDNTGVDMEFCTQIHSIF
jgi:hypothetical protein